MPQRRYSLTVLYSITFAAVNGLASVRLTACFLIYRIIAFPAMANRINISVFNQLAGRAGTFLASFLRTGRRGRKLPLAETVAGSWNWLCIGMCTVIFTGICPLAILCAGSFSGLCLLISMADGRNLCDIFYYITFLAMDGFTSGFCTSCWPVNCKISIPGVAGSCIFLIGTVITVLASVVFFPTYLRTSCRLCIVMYKIVAGSRDWLGVGMLAVILANIGFHTAFCAGGFLGHKAFIIMRVALNPSITPTTYRTLRPRSTVSLAAVALFRLAVTGITRTGTDVCAISGGSPVAPYVTKDTIFSATFITDNSPGTGSCSTARMRE